MSSAPLDRFYAIIPAGGIGSRLWPLSRAEAPKFLHDLTGSGRLCCAPPGAPRSARRPGTGHGRDRSVASRRGRAAVAGVDRREHRAGERAARLDRRDRTRGGDPAASTPGRHRRSFAADHVIRTPRGSMRRWPKRSRSPTPGGSSRSGSRRPSPRSGSATSAAARRSRSPERRTRSRRRASSRSRTWRPRAVTSPRAATSGTPACSSPGPTSCSRRSGRRIPPSAPARGARRSVGRAGPPRSGRRPIWPALTKIAIDYSVAEPAAAGGRMVVIPGSFDWDDVGDFASIAKLNSGGRPSDLVILGENARVLADASSGIVVSQSDRIISLIGVRDIVVVDTPDALLVTTSEKRPACQERRRRPQTIGPQRRPVADRRPTHLLNISGISRVRNCCVSKANPVVEPFVTLGNVVPNRPASCPA